MDIVLLTPTRLFGDGLAECLRGRTTVVLKEIVRDLNGLRAALHNHGPNAALIDVTQGADLLDLRTISIDSPRVALVALGLFEQKHQIIRCGRAGFTGYVSRDATVDTLCGAIADAAAGRLDCSAEISSGLLRALFHSEETMTGPSLEKSLTRREGDVLNLIGRGYSNKEIARDLDVSVATVKHHVHHILDKLRLQNRTQAMRRVRNTPWMVSTSAANRPA